MEEFHEADVIWSDHHHNRDDDEHDDNNYNYRQMFSTLQHNLHSQSKTTKNKKKKMKNVANSPPVCIPTTVSTRSWSNYPDSDESDYLDNEEEKVPPHIIVARRIAGNMAFSVCTGNGRTLKGRDLSQVRNSILRMTGFLET